MDNKTNKSKHNRLVKIYWLIIFILAFVLEKFELDFYEQLTGMFKWFLRIMLLPAGIELIKSYILSKNGKLNLSGRQQGMIENAVCFIVVTFRNARRNGLLCCLIVVFIFLYLPTASAHFQLIGRAIDLFGGMGYSQTDKPQEEPEKPQKDENKSEKKKEDESEIDKKEILETDFLADKKRYMELTPQEYNDLYFLTGEHAVLDWSDSKEVERCVADAVKDCIYKQMPNVFDAKAPQDVRDAISQASEDEKVMKNSDDLDRIIEVRMLNWELYPKYSLASLLAGNMQRYAMEYVNVNGSFKTIEYYYGQSVKWLFECLTYAGVSDYMLKSVYSSLEMRYNDISDAAEEGTDPQIRALALSKAFKKLQSN